MSTRVEVPFSFSADTFADVLHALKDAQYQCITFGEVLNGAARLHGATCLLRHDVDVSMDYAVDMARIEHEKGVRSTYFVMLRSPLYNLMSRHGADALAQILSLGHEVGLHFDAGCRFRSGKSIDEEVMFELAILSELTGQRVKAFSFHQPSAEAIQCRLAPPGVVNTYNPDQLAEYKYISDSNRIWRELDPFALVSSGFPHIQILLHPIWWMCPDNDVKDCWNRAIQRNFLSAQAQLLDTERAYGPPRSMSLF